jgi:hypothetical protein
MPSSIHSVQVYEELAECENLRGAPQMRDRYLVLAADAALAAGDSEEAERLRGRLLQLNPHHMLKPFNSLTEAMQSPDVLSYLANLRRVCTPVTAERLLESQRNARPAIPATVGPSGGNAHSDPHEGEVYRFQDEPPPPARPVQPVATVSTFPVVPVVPWTQAGDASTPTELRGGALWVAIGLFWLTLAAGLALAGYVLVRPFWQ